MRSVWKAMPSLAVLALSCVVLSSSPAHAQNAAGAPPSDQPAHMNPEWQGKLDDTPERREFREEAQQIRAAHEELEAQRDQLKAHCMDAKGQDRMQCHQQAEALHQQGEALHERWKALREKMELAREQHGGNGGIGALANAPGSGDPGAWRAHHQMNAANSSETAAPGPAPTGANTPVPPTNLPPATTTP